MALLIHWGLRGQYGTYDNTDPNWENLVGVWDGNDNLPGSNELTLDFRSAIPLPFLSKYDVDEDKYGTTTNPPFTYRHAYHCPRVSPLDPPRNPALQPPAGLISFFFKRTDTDLTRTDKDRQGRARTTRGTLYLSIKLIDCRRPAGRSSVGRAAEPEEDP